MTPWIKRSLFGLFGGALIAGSVAGCAGRHHGWGNASDADRAEMRAKMVERVSSKLELDAAQQQKLARLADTLQAQRKAVRGEGNPRQQFTALFAGSKLDQASAARLIDEKTAAVKAGSPQVIAAMADFFDHLRPDQQQKVRDFMQRGRHWGRHGG